MSNHKTIIDSEVHNKVRTKILGWSQLSNINVDEADIMLNDNEVYGVFQDKLLRAFSDKSFVKFYMEQSALSFAETRKSGSKLVKKVLDNSDI